MGMASSSRFGHSMIGSKPSLPQDGVDPTGQPGGPTEGGDEHTQQIHEHLKQMHSMTGHGHSHIEHKPEGHMAHHVDHEGNVSGPEEHGDCPGGMCEGGSKGGEEEAQYE